MEKLAALLQSAQRILVFTGAGISTDSGISDFRGPQGVWKQRQPVYLKQFMRSENARIEYWDQKLEAWPSFLAAKPNDTHLAVVDLERADKLLMVITQNIDGLHLRAGTSPKRLVELHGTNLWVECMRCHECTETESHMDFFQTTGEPPICSCGGFLKPATISFGQNLHQDELLRARQAALDCDFVISLGSTLSVYPAAMFPLVAARRGVPYIIVNRGTTDQDDNPSVTLRLEGDVTQIFPTAVSKALTMSSHTFRHD